MGADSTSPGSGNQVGLANANLNFNMGDLFSGDGVTRSRRQLRYQYRMAERYAGTHLNNFARRAEEAGLHPLFAMGASAGNAPTFDIPGQAPSGNHAVSAHLGPKPDAELDKLAKDKYRAEIELIRAEARNLANPGRSGFSNEFGEQLPRNIGADRAGEFKGIVSLEPDKQRTARKDDSSTSAATNPAWMKITAFQFGGTEIPIWLPWSEEGPAEAANAPLLWPITAFKNVQELGKFLDTKIAQGFKFSKKKFLDAWAKRPKDRKVKQKVYTHPLKKPKHLLK